MSGLEPTDRIAEILDAIADLPQESRACVAKEMCAGQESLLSEVLSLASRLDESVSSGHFLDDTNIDSRYRAMREAGVLCPGVADSPGIIGTRIDEFEIIGLLGAGGMGQVYEARQHGAITRDVALKVIRPGFQGDRVLRRFEAERQSLAVMEHPSIATVYAAGTTEVGAPFFAMELVRGVPLTEYFRERGLSLPEALHLFTMVCDAVQHAHVKGVIHRDVKPSNILVCEVDGRPVPKVIDFGIGKALAESDSLDPVQTLEGQVVGTPAYMSPEQARSGSGGIDTRSDVYSLGVVLYELLTGVRPFATDDLSIYEIQRLICEEDPPKPSERIKHGDRTESESPLLIREITPKRLQGELDWIVLKSLERDREHRYSSVAELSADVRSYLNHEPISVGPPTATYVLRKFVRRHRAATLAASIVMLSLISATAISVWFGFSESHQRSLAERAGTEAEAAKAEAELVADFQAKQLGGLDLETMGTFVQTRLNDAVAETRPTDLDSLMTATSEVNFADLARASLQKSVFDRAISAIASDYTETPVVQARLYHVTARTMAELGLHEAAEEPMMMSLRIRESELGANNLDTLASAQSMGWILSRLGRYEDAEAYYMRAYEGFLAVTGERDQRTLGALNDLALFNSRIGNYEAALGLYIQVVESCQQVLGRDHADTLTAQNNLAGVLHDLGRLDEAEQVYREVLDARTRTVGPNDPETVITVSNLGFLLMSQRKFDEAAPLLERSLSADRQRFGNEHPNTLASLSVMGGLHWTAGDYVKAESFFNEANDISARVLGPLHPLTLDAVNNMGLVMHSQGRFTEALEFHRSALAGRTEALGRNHPKTLTSIGRATNTLIELERWEEAESLALENERARRARYGGQHRRTISAIKSLINLYDKWGQHDAELDQWTTALEQAASNGGP